MAQARWRYALVAAFGTSMMLLGGCSTSRSTRVDDAWMARVPENELGDVRQAQANKRQALDEVTRAEVAIGDAQRALDVARSNAEAAQHQRKAQEATLKAAEATGQRSAIAQARAQLRGAEMDRSAAAAQVDWRKENVDAWKAQKRYREREATVADAELSYARYLALKRHDDVRAQDISERNLKSAIADAKRDASEARRDADAKTQEARRTRVAWEKIRSEAQGYGGSGRDLR
jgi:colicin import membrane protein